jgi:hypothetical protein
MSTTFSTTYELQMRSDMHGWFKAELGEFETLELAQRKQQFWNSKNREARIVEVTRRVL